MYIKRIDGAYVIDDLNELSQKLRDLLKDHSEIYKRKVLITEFAIKNHDMAVNAKELANTINCLIEEG